MTLANVLWPIPAGVETFAKKLVACLDDLLLRWSTVAAQLRGPAQVGVVPQHAAAKPGSRAHCSTVRPGGRPWCLERLSHGLVAGEYVRRMVVHGIATLIFSSAVESCSPVCDGTERRRAVVASHRQFFARLSELRYRQPPAFVD